MHHKQLMMSVDWFAHLPIRALLLACKRVRAWRIS
jgi:hypothetical protein